MLPWYKGYQGTIERVEGKGFLCTGKYEILSDEELEITELPIGKWTRDYKNFLEELAVKEEIDEIREYHQENRVHFVLVVPDLQKWEKKEGGILKKFKLQTSISSNNYVLFNPEGKLCRYGSELDIMKQFWHLRYALYEQRKAYMLASLNKEYEILFNRVKFIQAVIDDKLKITKQKRQVILRALLDFGLKPMSEIAKILKENPAFAKKKPSGD